MICVCLGTQLQPLGLPSHEEDDCTNYPKHPADIKAKTFYSKESSGINQTFVLLLSQLSIRSKSFCACSCVRGK